MRRIVGNQEAVLELDLLHGEISACVLQFVGKGNGVFAGNGGKILAEVRGEIQRNLLGLSGILRAKVIDTHHGVVDKVWPHLTSIL